MKKSWYSSKSIWGSIALAAIGISQIIIKGHIDTESLTTLAVAWGLFGLRSALD